MVTLRDNRQLNLILVDVLFLLILALLFFSVFVFPNEIGKVLVLFALISNLQQIFRFRDFDYIVVFLIFSLLYWFFMVPYYYYGIPYHYLTVYQTPELTNSIIILQLFLLRVMFFGIDAKKLNVPRSLIKPRRNSIIFISLVILLFVFAGIIVKTTPIAILSGEYSIETQSSLFLEYVLIPLIGAYLYADTKGKRFVFLLIAVVFLLLPLLYGKRLAFLMVALLIFNLFFSGKFKLKSIIVVIFLLYILLRFIALFRVGMSGRIDWSFLIFAVSESGIMSNNHGGVMVSSVTYLGLIEEGIYDWVFRLKSLLGTIIGTFIPSSMNFEEAYVNLYTMKYTAMIPGNGGFTAIYLYLWGGVVVVVLGGLLFNRLLRNPRQSRLIAIYFIFMMATFPRWYSYNMFILLKMGFWLLLFILIINTFNKYIR